MICNTEVTTSTQPCAVLAIPLPVPYQENKYHVGYINILYKSKKKIIKRNIHLIHFCMSSSIIGHKYQSTLCD
jgi:hypothetical protein